MGYMRQKYKYKRNFHGNKIPIEYLNKWNHKNFWKSKYVLSLGFQVS
jgi:hypothetical protein